VALRSRDAGRSARDPDPGPPVHAPFLARVGAGG
jgi:hypothetical protein